MLNPGYSWQIVVTTKIYSLIQSFKSKADLLHSLSQTLALGLIKVFPTWNMNI